MSNVIGNKSTEQALTGSIKTTASVTGKLIAKGYDGFSPIIIIDKKDRSTDISIEDANGKQTFTVNDGIGISSISIEEV